MTGHGLSARHCRAHLSRPSFLFRNRTIVRKYAKADSLVYVCLQNRREISQTRLRLRDFEFWMLNDKLQVRFAYVILEIVACAKI